MRRLFQLLSLMTLLLPSTSWGLTLHWSGGSSDLSFGTAARCTLLVEAEPGEYSLPAEWRLIWAVSNAGEMAPVVDTGLVSSGTAGVRETGWSSQAEEHAHVRDATLSALGSGFVSVARYIFDLPAGSAGKFQAVYRDPNTLQVLRTPIARFNGGASGSFPPVILESSAELRSGAGVAVTVQGSGLADATSAVLVARDNSWRVPLEIQSTVDGWSCPGSMDRWGLRMSRGRAGSGFSLISPGSGLKHQHEPRSGGILGSRSRAA